MLATGEKNVISNLTHWWTLHCPVLISQTKMCPLVQQWNEYYGGNQSLLDWTLRLITQEGTQAWHYKPGQKPVTREVTECSVTEILLLFH